MSSDSDSGKDIRDIHAVREELVAMVKERLSPVALRYGYSEVPLETHIKWRPQVLILGNYSSGKSTLINELLGADIQATGQAPTDDSFTVITFDDKTPVGSDIQVTEQRDGMVLLGDPEFPYAGLKRHGQRFAAHFRLKKVNSPFLKNLALIDTPGMLDSMAERDRGYNYQEVIGDLAQIADLVLVLFDPHKAGTVREAHASLRDTLPSATFEDRVLFVLNRIDECTSLNDLLRVYGTLCWNLSQMLGRKDIPPIHLTYSPRARGESRALQPLGGKVVTTGGGYLNFLENQREQLRHAITQAPRYRLDHLASYVEQHGERLSHFLDVLLNYRKARRTYGLTTSLLGMIPVAIIAAVFSGWMIHSGTDPNTAGFSGFALALGLAVLWVAVFVKILVRQFHTRTLDNLDPLAQLTSQSRKDTWGAIKEPVKSYLKTSQGIFNVSQVVAERQSINNVLKQSAREARRALNDPLSTALNY
jgi:GTPase SAR1 family protein